MANSNAGSSHRTNVREMIKVFSGSQRPNELPKDELNRISEKTERTSSSAEDSNDEGLEETSHRFSSATAESDEDFTSDEDEDASHDQARLGRYLNIPEIMDETRNFLREEENYCQLLEDLVENYINVLETDKFDDVLDVFGRIDLICTFQNNTFLPDLKSSRNVSEIADCFIKHKKLFSTYYECYFKNQQNMILIIKENKDVFKVLHSKKEYKEYEDTLLKSPNERIQSYHNFLESTKNILVSNIDVTNFDRAIEIIENLTNNFSPKDENIRFIISEIVETERIYVEKLEKITENIIPKIESGIKLKSRRKAIIGTVPLIYAKQVHFYDDLRECLFAFDPNEVGGCFIQHKDNFMLYVKDQQMKNNPEAIDECREFLEIIQERNFDFHAPLNRLYKYKILLQELKKSCNKGAVPCDGVEDAVNMITGIISKMNGAAAINCIKDENIYLDEQGELILRDEFLVHYKAYEYDAMVFLFEKSIIFTEIKTEGPKRNRRDVFIYKNHIITKNLALTLNSKSQTNFQLAFYGRNTKILHVLKAKDQTTKDTWTSTIKGILMKQFQEEKQNNI